jgi:hypothetical protein
LGEKNNDIELTEAYKTEATRIGSAALATNIRNHVQVAEMEVDWATERLIRSALCALILAMLRFLKCNTEEIGEFAVLCLLRLTNVYCERNTTGVRLHWRIGIFDCLASLLSTVAVKPTFFVGEKRQVITFCRVSFRAIKDRNICIRRSRAREQLATLIL